MKDDLEVFKTKIEQKKIEAIGIINKLGPSAVHEKTGIPVSSLSDWKNGRRELKVENVVAILEGMK